MEKVKLPRDVAAAIEHYKGFGKETLFREIIFLDQNKCCSQEAAVLYTYFKKKGWLFFAEALINGYDIEDEPITVTITAEMQENLRKFLRDQVQLENHTYIFAIKKAFEIVGIRIPGVND